MTEYSSYHAMKQAVSRPARQYCTLETALNYRKLGQENPVQRSETPVVLGFNTNIYSKYPIFLP
jgi:hypothetical protein